MWSFYFDPTNCKSEGFFWMKTWPWIFERRGFFHGVCPATNPTNHDLGDGSLCSLGFCWCLRDLASSGLECRSFPRGYTWNLWMSSSSSSFHIKAQIPVKTKRSFGFHICIYKRKSQCQRCTFERIYQDFLFRLKMKFYKTLSFKKHVERNIWLPCQSHTASKTWWPEIDLFEISGSWFSIWFFRNTHPETGYETNHGDLEDVNETLSSHLKNLYRWQGCCNGMPFLAFQEDFWLKYVEIPGSNSRIEMDGVHVRIFFIP